MNVDVPPAASEGNPRPWQTVEPFTIVWTDEGLRTGGERSRSLNLSSKDCKAPVEILRQRGLGTEGEAAMAVPRLGVRVQCQIKPRAR